MRPNLDPRTTVWQTEKQHQEAKQSLGWGTRGNHEFQYDGQFTCNSSHKNQSLWSQEFLPYIYIGEESAMIAHYAYPDREEHKYGLIIDVSMCGAFLCGRVQFKHGGKIPSHHKAHYAIGDGGKNLSQILSWLETQEIFKQIDEAVDQGKKVLINCQAGQSRSSTISILYMMQKYKIGVVQAYQHLRKYRAIVMPNIGYLAALLAYEATLKDIQPISLDLAADWLYEYATGTSAAFTQQNDQYIASFADTPKQYSMDYETDGASAFIQCVSFLQANNIVFTTIECEKHNGKIVLTKEGYDQYQSSLAQCKEAKVLEAAQKGQKEEQRRQEEERVRREEEQQQAEEQRQQHEEDERRMQEEQRQRQQEELRRRQEKSAQQAQRNKKLCHLAISQAAALTASSAVVVPSVLGLTGDFTSMHAMMLTGAIFAVSTAVCIYMNNKNLKSGIAIFVLETGITAGVSYVSFTIAPAMVDSGLSLPAADAILCAGITGLLLLANFGTQFLMNKQTTNTAEVAMV